MNKIESLKSEVDANVEETWRVEIQRRLAELDAGIAKTVPWEDVKAKLLRLIDDSRTANVFQPQKGTKSTKNEFVLFVVTGSV